jgi:antitoxin component YwqK of YwqJK toxin-antitoxin module
VITRLERDKNGDGFRDHVAIYQDGKLVREERDDDGDGRTDLISYFDASEQLARVEEDSNGDGEMDVVSYYEGGRLARREVLDASVLGSAPHGETEIQ